MALIGAAFGIGFTFGPLLGALFVSSDPLAGPSPAAGYVASVLSGVAFLMAIFVLPESLQPDSKPRAHNWFNMSSIKTAIARPAIGLVLLAIFLTTFAFAQFESTLSRLTQELGINDKYNFLLFAYIGFILAFSQGFLVRRLIPKMGEYRMSFAGTALMAVGLALIGLAGWSGSVPMLYAVVPVTVVGTSAVTPSLYSLLSLRTPASEQGAVLGTGQSMAALARIFGPIAGFSLFRFDRTYPYWFGAATMAIGIVLISMLKTQSSSDVSSTAPMDVASGE
jgi:DHA1 family tetracycline resistance protein-like MFS transporter